ncbi:MAG: hypothetical protein EXR72_16785 [Myxococcales bacterium]|nr:hypothetical protein [Myxococcales bacterium]
MTTTASAGYEFTAEQNETFKGLVRNMARSGVVVVVASVILLGYNAIEHFGISLGGTPSPAVYSLDLVLWCLISAMGGVVGVLLVRATAGFSAVIKTEGNDLEHLMSSMARLRDILGLIFWAATAASLLLAVSFILRLTYA